MEKLVWNPSADLRSDGFSIRRPQVRLMLSNINEITIIVKIEWEKQDKEFYLPKNKPGLIDIPPLNFFVISGKGNPNDEFFGEYIGVLYALSYAVKMSPKSGNAPDKYFEYTVYPLEGVWDFEESAKSISDDTTMKRHRSYKWKRSPAKTI